MIVGVEGVRGRGVGTEVAVFGAVVIVQVGGMVQIAGVVVGGVGV